MPLCRSGMGCSPANGTGFSGNEGRGKKPGLGASGAAAAVTGRTTSLMVRAPLAVIRSSPMEIHAYQTSKIIAEGLARRYQSRGWR